MTQTTLREYLRTTEDAISSGRINEAMANCQNILAYFPEALEAQHLLGEVYLAQGQLEEAQQTFEWILTNDPENVIVYCDRALISERNSDIDTALDCYQQAYELSRGNANIRQEFNQLSARAGQQEFMFSRAGLARLYMRGNLLTQAIQEWEAVLAINPDRLDARLGLIETYWREGMLERAEQLATRLLEEVPTCLKALLYLAHITSIANIARARELLDRAETLDPELRMAQEIFAELAANQPTDPFLVLIQREPILLEDGVPLNKPVVRAPMAAAEPAAPAIMASPLSPMPPTPSGANWGAAAQAPSGANWDAMSKTPSGANWNVSPEAPWLHEQAEPALPSWQDQLEPLTATQAEQPWYENEQYSAASAAPAPSWENLPGVSPSQSNWHLEVPEEEQSAPPAWLDNLTRSEPAQVVEPVYQAPPAPTPVQPQMPPVVQPQAASADEAMPFFFPSDTEENEGEMGWPEWLKSLGAESLEPEAPSEPLSPIEATPVRPPRQDTYASQPDWMQQLAVPADEPEQPATPDWMQQVSTPASEPTQSAPPDWMQQFSTPVSEPTPSATPDWMQQFARAESQAYQQSAMSTPVAEQEQRYLASLEDLEKDLQAQGFTPLAPGALASIAQANAPTPTQPQEQSSLSSALAQLGNFAQPPVAPASPAASAGEPWWNTMLSQEASAPTASPRPAEQVNPFAALGARDVHDETSPMPTLPATPAPVPTEAFQASTEQASTMNTPLMPAYRSDALLDSELETTMKRPAIKLQAMQPGDRPYHNGKSHGSERPPIDHGSDSNLGNRERLVRGYQYQLAGAYDEAMNDYRLIIRNAPELVDDVINNMRALLKLNPRFSLGYRVLGDAYMRKGEYLQAMESYNKALTMAKKAKA